MELQLSAGATDTAAAEPALPTLPPRSRRYRHCRRTAGCEDRVAAHLEVVDLRGCGQASGAGSDPTQPADAICCLDSEQSAQRQVLVPKRTSRST